MKEEEHSGDDFFDEIRPYNDDEVERIVKEKVIPHPYTKKVLEILFPNLALQETLDRLSKIRTIDQFQFEVSLPVFRKVIITTSEGLEIRGFDPIIKGHQNYLFFSTHRDILLDSVLLNVAFARKGLEFTESAIGTNLVEGDYAKAVALLNRNFLVLRNAPNKEIFEYSKKLANYVQHVLRVKKRSIWLSHREGRTKDGNDKTHSGILKMLHMAKPKDQDTLDFFASLNIVPMTVSYERDATLPIRLPSILSERKGVAHIKTKNEDMRNMLAGLLNEKKRICMTFSSPLSKEDLLSFYDKNDSLNIFIKKMCSYMDEVIYKNYKLYSSNYIAFDMMEGTDRHKDLYTPFEKKDFDNYLTKLLEKVEIEINPKEFRSIALSVYANPVYNYYKSINHKKDA